MKRIAKLLLLVVLGVPLLNGYTASAGGSAYVIIDAADNTVLEQSNASARLPMASTTKIVTAIVALENAPADLTITIPEDCVGVEGSSMYLREGDEYSLMDLLTGMMLVSGNDAAEAVAHAVAGSDEAFVLLMNEKASQLGLSNTHFVNPHGLHDNEHYTSAYDLAVICAYAMHNEVFRSIVSAVDAEVTELGTGTKRKLHNKNRLLTSYNGANGIKIGYTKRAGRCLCASANKQGRELICVILNDGNWFGTAAALFDKYF